MVRTDDKKAAIYARFSTEKQDARSIDDQERRCRAAAALRGVSIVGIYSDEAVSGTHTQRDGLQRLLADVAKHKFRTVFVDDLSRLSRDLGDMWSLVFGTLASLDVVVIDCMTNLSSDHPASRTTFGAMGLVSDIFIQMVKAETHRGLEGRALAGFWTGGRVYGYSTVTEPNPPDPQHPRKIPVINPDEAQIILRVFRLAAEGMALRTIADLLNREGIPAPHDGGKGHKGARGWGHTTINNMLTNERFVGIWRWNAHKWIRMPGKRSRRRIERPESEHVVKTLVELALVPAELWAAVQTRFRKVPERGRRQGRGAKLPGSMLSGLMKCGDCGGSFVVVGRVQKAGHTYQNLGCGVNRSRGESICANRKTISERKVLEMLEASLRGLLQPGRVQAFMALHRKRWEDQVKGADVHEVEAQIRVAEQQARNATDAMVKVGHSPAMASALKGAEERVAALLARLEDTTRQMPALHPKMVEGVLRQLLRALDSDDVATARGLMLQFMEPLTMTRTPDGAYDITGGFSGFGEDGRDPSLAESANDQVAGARDRTGHILLPIRARVGPYSAPPIL